MLGPRSASEANGGKDSLREDRQSRFSILINVPLADEGAFGGCFPSSSATGVVSPNHRMARREW